MARPLPSALLLLFLLGRSAGAGRSDTCRVGPYGMPLLDTSEESSSHRAPRSSTSLRKTRAADPPAKETSRPWIRLGALAQEVSRSPTDSPEAGILMEGEQCNKWVDGQVNSVETFHCPTQENQWEMFCCGTCTAPYCCSSTKKRLDQASCSKVVRTENQELEEPAGPTVNKSYTISILEFIFIAVLLSINFILFFCYLRYWIECKEAQRVETAQLNLAHWIPAASVVDSPQPEESQRYTELPMAVGNVPGVIGGPQGVVPEEEKKEEEETDF